MEYYVMGDMGKACQYHDRAMRGIVEAEDSPMKMQSGLSLKRRREELKELISQRNPSLTEKEKDVCLDIRYKLSIIKPDKAIKFQPLQEVINKKHRWRREDLPTVRMPKVPSQPFFHYPFLLPDAAGAKPVVKKPRLAGTLSMAPPTYSPSV